MYTTVVLISVDSLYCECSPAVGVTRAARASVRIFISISIRFRVRVSRSSRAVIIYIQCNCRLDTRCVCTDRHDWLSAESEVWRRSCCLQQPFQHHDVMEANMTRMRRYFLLTPLVSTLCFNLDISTAHVNI